MLLTSPFKLLYFHPNQNLSSKGIKQTKSSRRIVLIGYWSVQYSKLWRSFSNGRQVVPTKTSGLHSQIGVAIFPSFWQEKPWRQNRTPSPFFVIVSLSMQHYVQADLLSHVNFINIVLGSSSWQFHRTWKEK